MPSSTGEPADQSEKAAAAAATAELFIYYI